VPGPYRHRNSTQGDSIAVRLYEDLFDVGRSRAYVERVSSGLCVLNAQNKRHGVSARRGDGSFGEIVPNEPPASESPFNVMRGPIATIEIGIEVKILAKAMIKQIDRVVSDLTGQVAHFKSRGGRPITVGIVGVNHAPYAVSWEGDREWRTDGRKHKHPLQEAADAERRLLSLAAPAFDEFLILQFSATNDATPAYAFQWVDARKAELDYGAILARVGTRYQAQHG
jgi:hypothetical protein